MRLQNKKIAIVTSFIFLITNFFTPGFCLPAASAEEIQSAPVRVIDPLQINVPADFGKVEAVHRAAGKKMVILIQDAHAIPDAQRNIRFLIEHFQKRYGLGLVAVEGAASKLDPQIFRSFPDKKLLGEVFEEYRRNGELAGNTDAAVFNDREAVYSGVEDWDLYEEGLYYYLLAMKREAELAKKISRAQADLESRKAKVYSPELLKVDAALKDFYLNQANLVEVLRALAEFRPPPEGSELKLLLDESGREGESAPAVQAEVNRIAVAVGRHLKMGTGSEKAARLRLFNTRLQDFKTSQISPQAFALFLKETIAEERIPVKMSGALLGMTDTQKTLNQIEGTRLFEELERYIGTVKASLIKNENERVLERETERLRLAEKLIRLELRTKDWDSVKADPEGMKTFLPGDLAKAHRLFYENAERRDDVFASNLARLMENEKTDSAILISGGFHSEGVGRVLKEMGYSYVTVFPKIGSLPEVSAYREQMTGNVSWKDHIKVEDGKIDIYAAFVRSVRDRVIEAASAATDFKQRASNLPAVRVLKSWRDQIIRDLSAAGKVEKADEYTRFIDEVVKNDARRKASRDELEKKLGRVDRFIRELQRLEHEDRVTQENVLRLLQTGMIQSMVAQTLRPDRFDLGGRFNFENWILVPLEGAVLPAAASEVRQPGVGRDEPGEAPDVSDKLVTTERPVRDPTQWPRDSLGTPVEGPETAAEAFPPVVLQETTTFNVVWRGSIPVFEEKEGFRVLFDAKNIPPDAVFSREATRLPQIADLTVSSFSPGGIKRERAYGLLAVAVSAGMTLASFLGFQAGWIGQETHTALYFGSLAILAAVEALTPPADRRARAETRLDEAEEVPGETSQQRQLRLAIADIDRHLGRMGAMGWLLVQPMKDRAGLLTGERDRLQEELGSLGGRSEARSEAMTAAMLQGHLALKPGTKEGFDTQIGELLSLAERIQRGVMTEPAQRQAIRALDDQIEQVIRGTFLRPQEAGDAYMADLISRSVLDEPFQILAARMGALKALRTYAQEGAPSLVAAVAGAASRMRFGTAGPRRPAPVPASKLEDFLMDEMGFDLAGAYGKVLEARAMLPYGRLPIEVQRFFSDLARTAPGMDEPHMQMLVIEKALEAIREKARLQGVELEEFSRSEARAAARIPGTLLDIPAREGERSQSREFDYARYSVAFAGWDGVSKSGKRVARISLIPAPDAVIQTPTEVKLPLGEWTFIRSDGPNALHLRSDLESPYPGKQQIRVMHRLLSLRSEARMFETAEPAQKLKIAQTLILNGNAAERGLAWKEFLKLRGEKADLDWVLAFVQIAARGFDDLAGDVKGELSRLMRETSFDGENPQQAMALVPLAYAREEYRPNVKTLAGALAGRKDYGNLTALLLSIPFSSMKYAYAPEEADPDKSILTEWLNDGTLPFDFVETVFYSPDYGGYRGGTRDKILVWGFDEGYFGTLNPNEAERARMMQKIVRAVRPGDNLPQKRAFYDSWRAVSDKMPYLPNFLRSWIARWLPAPARSEARAVALPSGALLDVPARPGEKSGMQSLGYAGLRVQFKGWHSDSTARQRVARVQLIRDAEGKFSSELKLPLGQWTNVSNAGIVVLRVRANLEQPYPGKEQLRIEHSVLGRSEARTSEGATGALNPAAARDPSEAVMTYGFIAGRAEPPEHVGLTMTSGYFADGELRGRAMDLGEGGKVSMVLTGPAGRQVHLIIRAVAGGRQREIEPVKPVGMTGEAQTVSFTVPEEMRGGLYEIEVRVYQEGGRAENGELRLRMVEPSARSEARQLTDDVIAKQAAILAGEVKVTGRNGRKVRLVSERFVRAQLTAAGYPAVDLKTELQDFLAKEGRGQRPGKTAPADWFIGILGEGSPAAELAKARFAGKTEITLDDAAELLAEHIDSINQTYGRPIIQPEQKRQILEEIYPVLMLAFSNKPRKITDYPGLFHPLVVALGTVDNLNKTRVIDTQPFLEQRQWTFDQVVAALHHDTLEDPTFRPLDLRLYVSDRAMRRTQNLTRQKVKLFRIAEEAKIPIPPEAVETVSRLQAAVERNVVYRAVYSNMRLGPKGIGTQYAEARSTLIEAIDSARRADTPEARALLEKTKAKFEGAGGFLEEMVYHPELPAEEPAFVMLANDFLADIGKLLGRDLKPLPAVQDLKQNEEPIAALARGHEHIAGLIRQYPTMEAQLEMLERILHDPEFATEMAKWLNDAYFIGIGQIKYPEFISTTDTPEQIKMKVAINLAGFYALEGGIGVLSERSGYSPMEILDAIREGRLGEKDMLLLARFANATWKASQPFRDLARITKPNFIPAVKLTDEELRKDFVQIVNAAGKLGDELRSFVQRQKADDRDKAPPARSEARTSEGATGALNPAAARDPSETVMTYGFIAGRAEPPEHVGLTMTSGYFADGELRGRAMDLGPEGRVTLVLTGPAGRQVHLIIRAVAGGRQREIEPVKPVGMTGEAQTVSFTVPEEMRGGLYEIEVRVYQEGGRAENGELRLRMVEPSARSEARMQSDFDRLRSRITSIFGALLIGLSSPAVPGTGETGVSMQPQAAAGTNASTVFEGLAPVTGAYASDKAKDPLVGTGTSRIEQFSPTHFRVHYDISQPGSFAGASTKFERGRLFDLAKAGTVVFQVSSDNPAGSAMHIDLNDTQGQGARFTVKGIGPAKKTVRISEKVLKTYYPNVNTAAIGEITFGVVDSKDLANNTRVGWLDVSVVSPGMTRSEARAGESPLNIMPMMPTDREIAEQAMDGILRRRLLTSAQLEDGLRKAQEALGADSRDEKQRVTIEVLQAAIPAARFLEWMDSDEQDWAPETVADVLLFKLSPRARVRNATALAQAEPDVARKLAELGISDPKALNRVYRLLNARSEARTSEGATGALNPAAARDPSETVMTYGFIAGRAEPPEHVGLTMTSGYFADGELRGRAMDLGPEGRVTLVLTGPAGRQVHLIIRAVAGGRQREIEPVKPVGMTGEAQTVSFTVPEEMRGGLYEIEVRVYQEGGRAENGELRLRMAELPARSEARMTAAEVRRYSEAAVRSIRTRQLSRDFRRIDVFGNPDTGSLPGEIVAGSTDYMPVLAEELTVTDREVTVNGAMGAVKIGLVVPEGAARGVFFFLPEPAESEAAKPPAPAAAVRPVIPAAPAAVRPTAAARPAAPVAIPTAQDSVADARQALNKRFEAGVRRFRMAETSSVPVFSTPEPNESGGSSMSIGEIRAKLGTEVTLPEQGDFGPVSIVKSMQLLAQWRRMNAASIPVMDSPTAAGGRSLSPADVERAILKGEVYSPDGNKFVQVQRSEVRGVAETLFNTLVGGAAADTEALARQIAAMGPARDMLVATLITMRRNTLAAGLPAVAPSAKFVFGAREFARARQEVAEKLKALPGGYSFGLVASASMDAEGAQGLVGHISGLGLFEQVYLDPGKVGDKVGLNRLLTDAGLKVNNQGLGRKPEFLSSQAEAGAIVMDAGDLANVQTAPDFVPIVMTRAGEVDNPFVRDFTTVLQAAVALLVAHHGKAELLKNPLPLLEKYGLISSAYRDLYRNESVIVSSQNGRLMISAVAVRAYLEWKAAQQVQMAA